LEDKGVWIWRIKEFGFGEYRNLENREFGAAKFGL
jgi:hypothetical protein